ncbi:MAG: type II toxin-antitoxin system HigA family antitoxin [Gammaproteobacteria bacterium]
MNKTNTTNNILQKAIQHWSYISPLVTYPKNQNEFDFLVHCLDKLLDLASENENHPLMGLIDIISSHITTYEDQHLPKISGSGIDALRFLMDSHRLKQSDLPEIGSQGVVSEILSGKRKLNLRQIKALAKRFKVATETFIG